jgi:hypothetical protein
LCDLLLHLWWKRHGAHRSQRVERLLYMVVMMDMRMVWVVVVVVVRLRSSWWLRVWSRLWYGSEWVRLERGTRW